jgi:hypothetical protein
LLLGAAVGVPLPLLHEPDTQDSMRDSRSSTSFSSRSMILRNGDVRFGFGV